MELEANVKRQGDCEPGGTLESSAASLEVTSGSNIGAAEYVFQTRRLAEVLRVMQSDGNTVEEIERVRNELRGRYAEIEKWPPTQGCSATRPRLLKNESSR